MKTLPIIIALLLTAAVIYTTIWNPILNGIIGFVLIFFAIFWLVWGILEIKVKRHYKQLQRFRWYNKMGLLESGYILEPKYATKYWRNLISEFLK
ncbi:hypothetical protein LCGC14_1082610 [marine sediment metagenome]|uniref:Uncharacterized protein n=1 Tax=marine sediment metagenome TaxID=412755 RepID=A0A0F9N2I7_9ZZZZ